MITFEQLSTKHQSSVMKIYNYYVETTTSAFLSQSMPEEYFKVFLNMTEGKYPAYAVMDGDQVGEFEEIGEKLGRKFGLVLMQRDL